MPTDFSRNMGSHLDLPSALSKIGEETAVRDMLGMLADLLAQDVPRIEQALRNQDTGVAAPLLHSLKGCMPIFCTLPICDQVAQVELHAKRGEAGLAQAAYGQLAPAFADLALEIQQQIALWTASVK